MPPLAHRRARLGTGLEHHKRLGIRVKMGSGRQTHRPGANDSNW
jgi:hypothetical protein